MKNNTIEGCQKEIILKKKHIERLKKEREWWIDLVKQRNGEIDQLQKDKKYWMDQTEWNSKQALKYLDETIQQMKEIGELRGYSSNKSIRPLRIEELENMRKLESKGLPFSRSHVLLKIVNNITKWNQRHSN